MGKTRKSRKDFPPVNQGKEETKTWAQIWREYPKSVFFIVGNELCERFSSSGMGAILMMYMVNILRLGVQNATQLYSGLMLLFAFTPILGSILADGYIGKYHTILWVSLFYAAGDVVVAVAAAFEPSNYVHPWLDIMGLVIKSVGAGGIKPCAQPFGCDQFQKGQEKQLQNFFSLYYFAINAGSLVSVFITPMLRTRQCQGQNSCYPLAFGVPSALMVIAVVIFALGTPWYKKMPPEGNVFSQSTRTIYVALKNKRFFDIKRSHWLDHYMDNHNCTHDDDCRQLNKCHKVGACFWSLVEFIQDLKAFGRILIVYVPLPVFWSLYSQQGSTWVIQATQMNGELADGLWFLPDQMAIFNAVLVLATIPLFQIIVYPLIGKSVKLT